MVIHIGTHKTGSTTIQHLCWKHSDILLEAGWLYPQAGRLQTGPVKGHHALASCIRGSTKFSMQEEFDIDSDPSENALIRELSDEISNHPDINVLISSEGFSHCDKKTVKVIKDLFSDFDVTIVVYIRNKLNYMVSQYKHLVTNIGYTESFRAHIEQHSQIDKYFEILDTWSSVFGRDRIKLQLFDKVLLESGVTYDFFNILKLSDETISAIPSEFQINVSPGDNVIYLLRMSNRLINRVNRILPRQIELKPLKISYSNRFNKVLSFILDRLYQVSLFSKSDVDLLRKKIQSDYTRFMERYIEPEDWRYLQF